MVFWFGAPGVFGAALLLLAMVIGECVSRGRRAERKRIAELAQNSLMLLTSLRPAIGWDKSSKIVHEEKGFAGTAESSAFCFYCGADFVYLHFRSIPRLRKRKRSVVRTATRQVKARTGISLEIGTANARACWSAAYDSISNT